MLFGSLFSFSFDILKCWRFQFIFLLFSSCYTLLLCRCCFLLFLICFLGWGCDVAFLFMMMSTFFSCIVNSFLLLCLVGMSNKQLCLCISHFVFVVFSMSSFFVSYIHCAYDFGFLLCFHSLCECVIFICYCFRFLVLRPDSIQFVLTWLDSTWPLISWKFFIKRCPVEVRDTAKCN